MTTKEPARDRISRAAVATTAIRTQMRSVVEKIEDSKINAASVLSDPLGTEHALLSAKAHIEEALKALKAVEWSTADDHDI